MKEILNSDEFRLLQFFRSLSEEGKFEAMAAVASKAVEECIPNTSIYELMPDDVDIKPEGIDFIYETYSVSHVIHCGMEETGDPEHYLFGTSLFDESFTIPNFVYGAGKAADEQGRWFNYDKEFARNYINSWRQEIALACVRFRETEAELNKNLRSNLGKRYSELPLDLQKEVNRQYGFNNPKMPNKDGNLYALIIKDSPLTRENYLAECNLKEEEITDDDDFSIPPMFRRE
ncbi:MAG: hypothetical protein JSS81_09700 [Acidobacteria bacterium]|nr:hypothetical protein [Acidobacteriota bacterium]